MIGNTTVGTAFREGDQVVLAQGTYQGTLGVFVRLRKDANWADVTERNGSVRTHPVAWLEHSAA
jgi:transcription antitermination factor NusG